MDNVLITGSSGYIGTSIAEALFNNGYKLKLASRKKHILCKNQKVSHIKVSKDCTFCQFEKYFSFRREGDKSGRMFGLIGVK